MIHVISEKIAAASQLDKCHCLGISATYYRSPVFCHLQPTSQLRSEVRNLFHIKGNSNPYSMVGADVVIISFFREQIVPRGLDFCQPLIPGSLTVATHNRKHSACHSSSPAGCRVNRDLQSDLFGNLPQHAHVCFPFFSGSSTHMTILILNLYHRNRTVVRQKKSSGLLCNFSVKFPDIAKIFRIIGSCY